LASPDAFPALAAPERGVDEQAARIAVAPAGQAECWRPWRALAATHLWFADQAAADQRLRGAA
jgi:3-methyladenine DNA glycosylase/8-oxoguanine DNA glycosylase